MTLFIYIKIIYIKMLPSTNDYNGLVVNEMTITDH
jgi:hypothetical protein